MAIRMAIRMAMENPWENRGENHDSWIVWWCFWWEISPIWMGELSELHQNKQKLPSLVTGCHRLWLVSRGIWMGNKLHQKLGWGLWVICWWLFWWSMAKHQTRICWWGYTMWMLTVLTTIKNKGNKGTLTRNMQKHSWAMGILTIKNRDISWNMFRIYQYHGDIFQPSWILLRGSSTMGIWTLNLF